MMNNGTQLTTVEQIARFTNEKVKLYRMYPSKKQQIVSELACIFADDQNGWTIVIDMGRFRPGFTRVLGKKGMVALKKLLYDLDIAKYQNIEFGVD